MQKKYAQIKKELNEMNSVDLAELLEQFPQENMVVLFRLIAKETAAEVFTNMNTEMQQALISTFTEKELKDIFEDMFLDDTVDILEEMPANVVERILDVTDKETRSLHQRTASISARQRRQHHDDGICRPEKDHERA